MKNFFSSFVSLDRFNIKLDRLSSFYLDNFNYKCFRDMFLGFTSGSADANVIYYLHVFNTQGQLVGLIIPFVVSGDSIELENFVNRVYEKVCYDSIQSVGNDLTKFYIYIGNECYKSIDDRLL
jgi:hypothetical protein